MADLRLVSGGGQIVTCHRVIFSALGQFIATVLKDSDQIILPDFSMDGITGLLYFLYIGE